MTRLRAFLALLEAHGGGEIRACELAVALAKDGPEARSALRAQGIVRDAPRAETVPCDGLGCAREVRELGGGPGAGDRRGRRFVGVCTRDPEECETVTVDEADLAQERISREAFVAAVQRALRLAPARPGPRGGEPRAREGADVVLLGEELIDGEPRDVLLAWRPESPELRAVLGERATGARRARALLLASPRTGETDLHARHGASPGVTIDPLDELLTVRDGQLAELPRLSLVQPQGAPARMAIPPLASPPRPPRSPALDGLRTIERWGELTLFDVDQDDLLGVTFDARLRRLSCVDFGLATVDGRRPIDVFVLLKTICQGNGLFVTRRFGTASNGKRLMSELRTALRATFGLAGDPFEPYSRKTHMWKPKFRALSAAPAELAAAMKELGPPPGAR